MFVVTFRIAFDSTEKPPECFDCAQHERKFSKISTHPRFESILSRAEGFKTTIYAGVNLSTVVQIDHAPISFFPRVETVSQ